MAGGIRSYSTTAANNNAATPYGWPEGQPPSSVNNVARQNMADLRAWYENPTWIDFGDTPTRVSNTVFTVATDLTARYAAGRRIQLIGATTGYATISSATYSAPDTTITVVMDSGNVPTSLTNVSVSALSLAPEGSDGTRRTAAEIAAGVTPTNYAYAPFNILRYGADPTAVAASDTALANAISVCGTTGGRIVAPAGDYKFASAINLNQKTSIIIEGDGAATGGAQPATRFAYTGTGSGNWITMQSSVGCILQNLQITHNNASFTGTYIKCGNDGTHGDSTFCAVIDCVLGNSVSTVIHLDLDKATQFTASRCNFIYGNPSVKGQASGGGSYSNVIRFKDCRWGSCAVAPVYDCGQSWEFDACNFEQLSTNAAGAILTSSTAQLTVLRVVNCWMGDATTGGIWINIKGSAIVIEGNYISGNATSTAIQFATVHGATVVANNFTTHSVGINFADAACAEIEVTQNLFSSVTTVFGNGNNVTQGFAVVYSNFGGGILGTNHQVIGTNGYVIDPSRVMTQWGTASVTVGVGQTVTFPLAFPNACQNVVCTIKTCTNTTTTVFVTAVSTTTFTCTINDAAGTDVIWWQAIGF